MTVPIKFNKNWIVVTEPLLAERAEWWCKKLSSKGFEVNTEMDENAFFVVYRKLKDGEKI